MEVPRNLLPKRLTENKAKLMGGSLRVSLWLMGKELTLRLWFIKTQ
jgi:hypothetical protein